MEHIHQLLHLVLEQNQFLIEQNRQILHALKVDQPAIAAQIAKLKASQEALVKVTSAVAGT